jgi:hypothetical protein
MTSSKRQTVSINDKFKVDVDPYNHTLMHFAPSPKRPDHWEVVGYYSTMAGALNKLTQTTVLDGADADLISYCQAILSEAKAVCHHSK